MAIKICTAAAAAVFLWKASGALLGFFASWLSDKAEADARRESAQTDIARHLGRISAALERRENMI